MGGLGRRRTKGGGRVGRGREWSHSCPDLAIGSRLPTQVLWLRKEEKHFRKVLKHENILKMIYVILGVSSWFILR